MSVCLGEEGERREGRLVSADVCFLSQKRRTDLSKRLPHSYVCGVWVDIAS